MKSLYIPLRDGVRIAIDVWLPSEAIPVPTIVRQTRYLRSLRWGPLARLTPLPALLDINGLTRRRFVDAGYAWVDVDVRGSGASSGHQSAPWWRDEVADGVEVVDWIVRQPWSNGLVGATGISYDGTAAEMLASGGHEAVRAVAPRFSLFDVFTDVAFPGGLHLSWFTERWARFNAALDRGAFHDAVALLATTNLEALGGPNAGGLHRLLSGTSTRGVTGRVVSTAIRLMNRGVVWPGGVTAEDRQAVARAHLENFDVHQAALQVVHRDDAGISREHPNACIDDFSPHRRAQVLRDAGVAVLSYSGWLDGAYDHAATKRFASVGGELVLGPWDHGGRQDVSPFSARSETDFDHDSELLRFFDRHLRDRGEQVPRVRYFTLGEERWHGADQFPPAGTRGLELHASSDGRLTLEPADEGIHEYRVDREVGSGPSSRWRSLIGLAAPVGYADRAALAERLLAYTSDPLPEPLFVTGHPVLLLRFSVDAEDVALFAYLEDVWPNGRVVYVTEGQLRARHRELGPRIPGEKPERSYRRADARALVPGVVCELALDLLPVSYRFGAGHAVRFTLAGADRDHFSPLPGPAPVLRVRVGGRQGTTLELPVVRGSGVGS